MKKITLAFICLAFITSCSTNKNVNQSNSKKMNSIFEIAINQSKDGQHPTFLETREKFVEVLSKEDATLNEGKWEPFFTVAPNLKLEHILKSFKICSFYNPILRKISTSNGVPDIFSPTRCSQLIVSDGGPPEYLIEPIGFTTESRIYLLILKRLKIRNHSYISHIDKSKNIAIIRIEA